MRRLSLLNKPSQKVRNFLGDSIMSFDVTTEDSKYIRFIEVITDCKYTYNRSLVLAIKAFINSLGPRQKRILILRFGFDGNEVHSYKKIAEILKEESDNIYSISESKISSIFKDIRSSFWSAFQNYEKSDAAHTIQSYAIKDKDK